MSIHELEISNYKTLDNINMPLIFNDLNIFIGENDAGKTSLIDAIALLFHGGMSKSMFYDINKDLIIKAKLKNIHTGVMVDAIEILKLDVGVKDYFRNILKHQKHDADNIQIYVNKAKTFSLLDYPSLKEFDFYKDLNSFLKYYIKNFCIVFERKYKFSKDKEIICILSAFFSYLDNMNQELTRLLSNEKFIDFMKTYLAKFDKHIEKTGDIVSRIINNLGISNAFDIESWQLDALSPETVSILKKYLNEISNLHQNRYCDPVRISKSICSIIFLDDDKDIVLSKIAKILSVFINNKSINRSDLWEIGGSVIPRFGKGISEKINPHTYENTSGLETASYIDEYEQITNIIGHSKAEYPNDEIVTLPKPDLFLLHKELSPQESVEAYYDLSSLKKKVNKKLKNIIIEYYLDFYKKLKEDKILKEQKTDVLKFLNLLGENLTDLKIDLNINNIEEALNQINLSLDLKAKEKNRLIDFVAKGDGFSRKFLLADLFRLQNLFDVIEEEGFGKIISIEEPELHLHVDSQKKIMKLLDKTIHNPGNQIFISTHSHFIINYAELKNIFIFKKDIDSGKTTISNINQYLDEPKILDHLQESLGLQKTDILFLKKLIIIVEGKNDIAFIKGLCKNKKYDLDHEEILFVEAKGQPNIEYFVGLGEFLGIMILIILDHNKENLVRKKRILSGKYKSRELKDSIIGVNILNQIDILNYLNPKQVEKYYRLPSKSIILNEPNIQLKHLLEKKGKYIKYEDVEFLVSQMPTIDKELETKIINIIKLFKTV